MSAKKLSFLFIVLNLIILIPNLPAFIIVISFISLFLSMVPTDFKRFVKIFKIVLLILSIILLVKQFKTLLVVEFGVSFVLVLAFLKALELETINDFFNMFLILILNEACIFIINPGSFVFILGILKIGFYFYFLLQMRSYSFSALNLKKLLTLILPATFFSILMFYTFPRFTQGFLNVNNTSYLFSGSNHDLNFRELGPIVLSEKEAFKVLNFPIDKFQPSNLYWRTNVLWDLRKGTWRPSYSQLKSIPLDAEKNNDELFKYFVKLPNQYNDFLPHFDSDTSLISKDYNVNYYSESTFKLTPGMVRSLNLSFSSKYKHDKFEYNSYQNRKGLSLISTQRDKVLNLLIGENSIDHLSIADKLKIIDTFFLNRNYIYTLTPPIYNSVEDFILTGKMGYCSHFASAYTYLLRVLNIPSRLIIGYLGGEINTFDNSILVREKDAHAWTEYYDGLSWKRVDPTEFVAPTRISEGSNLFYDNLNPFIENPYYKIPRSWIKFAFLTKASQFADSVENQFSNNLFNFDREDQQRFFKTNSGLYFVLIIIIFMSTSFLISKFLKREIISSEVKEYRRLLGYMKKIGLNKYPHETASEFFYRIEISHPELIDNKKEIILKYIQKTYQDGSRNE